MDYIAIAKSILTNTNKKLTIEQILSHAKREKIISEPKSYGINLPAAFETFMEMEVGKIFEKTETYPPKYYLVNQSNDNIIKPRKKIFRNPLHDGKNIVEFISDDLIDDDMINNNETVQVQSKKENISTVKNSVYDIIDDTSDDSLEEEHEADITNNFKERDLHPFLTYFAKKRLKAYTKTINHQKSSKKDYGEWTHPDIVGCYFPFETFKTEVADLSSSISTNNIKLFSFELKKEVTSSNLREAFFQAVSNSSWANEGYLVASKFSGNVIDTLRRLSSSFKLGIIKIDIEDIENSEILSPASPKEYLDWDMINQLATMNSDFCEFVKRVRNDIGTKEIIKEKYDKIYEKEELKKFIL